MLEDPAAEPVRRPVEERYLPPLIASDPITPDNPPF
jgi:hypothetical protein